MAANASRAAKARRAQGHGDASFDRSSTSTTLHHRFENDPEPISALEEEKEEVGTKGFQSIVQKIATLQAQLVEAHDQQVSSLRHELGMLKASSSPFLTRGGSTQSIAGGDRSLIKAAATVSNGVTDCSATTPEESNDRRALLRKCSLNSLPQLDSPPPSNRTMKSRRSSSTLNAYQQSRWLLHPQSVFVRHWEMLVMAALLFTAVVSPVEIAFMEAKCGLSWLLVVNQLINTIFFIDMILQFFIIFETKSSEGIRKITSHGLITKNYLKTWFTCDLASVIPFDTFGCIFDSEQLRKMKVARFVRLIRLLKLVRILRGSRIFARWQVNMAFPYTEQTLGKFVMVLIIGAHWMGCLWGIVGLETSGYSWMDALADGKPKGMYVKRDPVEKREPATLYLASLHFAFMTITSIGYGDIAPQQEVEYVVGALCQMCGGLLWAYGISEVIAVVSNLDPSGTQFRRTMDDLNHMMKSKGLNHSMQVRLRSFFLQARELHDQERYRDLLCHMSPQLMSDVARVTNAKWLKRVWYIKPSGSTDDHLTISDNFIAQIAVALQARVCSQGETLRSDATLRILVRGLAGQTGKILRAGDVWGEDFILETRALRLNNMTACLTFIEVQTLSRHAFQAVLHESGTHQDCTLIRKAVVKLAFLRGVQRLARAEKAKILTQKQSNFISVFGNFEHVGLPSLPMEPQCQSVLLEQVELPPVPMEHPPQCSPSSPETPTVLVDAVEELPGCVD